jgi:hypothetical protein
MLSDWLRCGWCCWHTRRVEVVEICNRRSYMGRLYAVGFGV